MLFTSASPPPRTAAAGGGVVLEVRVEVQTPAQDGFSGIKEWGPKGLAAFFLSWGHLGVGGGGALL